MGFPISQTPVRDSISLSNTIGISINIFLLVVGFIKFDLLKDGFGELPNSFFPKDKTVSWCLGLLLWVFINASNVIRFYLTSWLVDDEVHIKAVRHRMHWSFYGIEWSLRAVIWILVLAFAYNLTDSDKGMNEKMIEPFLVSLYSLYLAWDFLIILYCVFALRLPWKACLRKDSAEDNLTGDMLTQNECWLLQQTRKWLRVEFRGFLYSVAYLLATNLIRPTPEKRELYFIGIGFVGIYYLRTLWKELGDKSNKSYYKSVGINSLIAILLLFLFYFFAKDKLGIINVNF